MNLAENNGVDGVQLDENWEGEIYVRSPESFITRNMKLKGEGYLFRLSIKEGWQEEITIERIEAGGAIPVYIKVTPGFGQIESEYTKEKCG